MAGPGSMAGTSPDSEIRVSPGNPATTFFERKLRKLLGQDEARCQDKLF